MDNYIINNAYGILGLNVGASSKDIEKRIKEIEKLIKIDEIPHYDFDMLGFHRSLDSIKNIKQNLSNAKIKILHYFFGIHTFSEDDKQKLLTILADEFTFTIAMEYLKNNNTFINRKNIAILTYFYMHKNASIVDVDIEKYISIWKDLLDSKNVQNFKTMYKNDDDIGISDEVFDSINIQQIVISMLSNLIDNFNDLLIKRVFITHLINMFSLHNANIFHISFIDDCYKNIDKSIMIIEDTNISSSGYIWQNKITTALNNITSGFNRLSSLNLSNNSKTKMLKSRIYKILEEKSIKAYNELPSSDFSEFLLTQASKFCSNDYEKNQLKKKKEDLQKAKTNKKTNELLKKVEQKVEQAVKDKDLDSIDDIVDEIRRVVTDDIDDILDSVAIIIANAYLEELNKVSQNDIYGIIDVADSAKTALYKALKLAKKARTKEWIRSQINDLTIIDNLKSIYSYKSNNQSQSSHSTQSQYNQHSTSDSEGFITYLIIGAIIFAIIKGCS